MTDKTLAKETISKALAALQETAESVSKGHSSRGTATTAADTMRDASRGAGSDEGSTQVYHTPSNSDPNGWAGSRASGVPEDGATDSVDENGTDYNGVSSGLMKSIFEKIEKGEKLTEAERFVLKSVAKGGMDKDDDEDTKKGDFGKDDDDDDEEEAKKSLTDHASENEDVSKGFEMSSFLASWAQVQNDALQSAEQRIVNKVVKSLRDIEADNSAYQVEMAKSMAALAEVLALQGQRVEQMESTPARGPKSAQAIDKSFGAGGQEPAGQQLQKSQVLDTMIDMVEKSLLPAQEVVKFESTGELREDIYNQVLAHRQGR